MKYIKQAALVFMVASLWASDASAKKNDAQEYKCYLETTRGYQLGFYKWPVKQVEVLKAKLVGKKLASNERPMPYVKDVVECVGLYEEFSSAQAREADKNTVR